MFDSLKEYLINLIPLKYTLLLYALYKLGESLVYGISTDFIKLYVIKSQKERKWTRSYIIDIIEIVIYIGKGIFYFIVWYLAKDLIDDNARLNLKDLSISYVDDDNNIYEISGKNKNNNILTENIINDEDTRYYNISGANLKK